MHEDLVLIQVTAPLDHVGDVIGMLNGVRGWIDGYDEADPVRVLSRVPRDALMTVELWLRDNLPGRSKCTVLSGGVGNA